MVGGCKGHLSLGNQRSLQRSMGGREVWRNKSVVELYLSCRNAGKGSCFWSLRCVMGECLPLELHFRTGQNQKRWETGCEWKGCVIASGTLRLVEGAYLSQLAILMCPGMQEPNQLLKPNLIQFWALLETGRCAGLLWKCFMLLNSVFTGLPTHVASPVEKEERLHWL